MANAADKLFGKFFPDRKDKEFMMEWASSLSLMQQAQVMPGVTPVIVGPPGCGKTLFLERLAPYELFWINKPSSSIFHHPALPVPRLFVATEVCWTAREAEHMRHLVSHNPHSRFVVTSQFVPAALEEDERRFRIVHFSGAMVGDAAFFEELHAATKDPEAVTLFGTSLRNWRLWHKLRSWFWKQYAVKISNYFLEEGAKRAEKRRINRAALGFLFEEEEVMDALPLP